MEPIAIIGMACRLPGAPSLEEFWNLLRFGRHGIDLIPESRWDRERTFHPDPKEPGKINTRYGGFLEGIDLFDSHFFRIPGEEARQMDPQQRIMLELAYEAFTDAGLSRTELDGTDTGVFVGVMSNDYLRYQTADDYRLIDRYTGAGSGYCMIANRVSYQFNLRGPSMALDSACSSSLISTYVACQSLWTQQCSLALAGGVNLILSPTLSVFYTRNGLSAPDGKCKTLSNDASGMGRGEGAGFVLLKRLSDAQRDGDAIYALILGGATNHNGRGNGMSAPNRWAQQSLLHKAHKHAGVRPQDLDYVELHGTGTLIGDAIEANALGSVLAEDACRKHPCRVGSVKSNLGHLEGAAGIAGLIKLALCLSHRKLTPTLWYNGPNPYVALDALCLKVQDQLQDWPDHGQPSLAGISSFGLGGANAHLVLQSAPDLGSGADVNVKMPHPVLHLSAHSEAALIEMARRYGSWMDNLNEEQLLSLCQTSLQRPQGHEYRATFVACNRSDMIRNLSSFTFATPPTNVFTGRYREFPKRKCVFIFPDSHKAPLHSLAGLAAIDPCVHETLQECDRAIQEVLLHPIAVRPVELVELVGTAARPETSTLPFIHFGIQLALARLWQKAGFEPDAIAGIGTGLAASWVVAGAMDIKGAISRIAVWNSFQLVLTASSSLTQSCPFVIDCYSSLGKNVAPAAHEASDAVPDMPRWKAVDYFVHSLSRAPIEGFDFASSPLAALDTPSFWTELARLSVQHNIQWKSLLPGPMLTHPLPYPWQRSRFWLGPNQIPGVAAPPQTSDALLSDDGARDGGSYDQTSNGGNISGLTDGRDLAASVVIVSGLNREKLLRLSASERRSALVSYLKQKVVQILPVSTDELEESQTFTGIGIESLTALELKTSVEADLALPVSLVKLLDGHSIGDLAEDLLSSSLEPAPASISSGVPHESDSLCGEQELSPGLPDPLGSLRSDEIDRMLRGLMNGDPEQSLESIAR